MGAFEFSFSSVSAPFEYALTGEHCAPRAHSSTSTFPTLLSSATNSEPGDPSRHTFLLHHHLPPPPPPSPRHQLLTDPHKRSSLPSFSKPSSTFPISPPTKCSFCNLPQLPPPRNESASILALQLEAPTRVAGSALLCRPAVSLEARAPVCEVRFRRRLRRAPPLAVDDLRAPAGSEEVLEEEARLRSSSSGGSSASSPSPKRPPRLLPPPPSSSQQSTSTRSSTFGRSTRSLGRCRRTDCIGNWRKGERASEGRD